MQTMREQLNGAVRGRNPLIYVWSQEEERALDTIRELAAETAGGLPVRAWSRISGLEGMADSGQTLDPADALRALLADETPGFFVFRDLSAFIERPDVTRGLREFYYSARSGETRFLVVLAPDLRIPDMLKKETHLVDVPPPDEKSILAEVTAFVKARPGIALADKELAELVLALKGLTLDEIRHIMHRAFAPGAVDARGDLLSAVFAEKEVIVKKTGYLEFCTPRWGIDDIGGLANLKDWLEKRKKIFSREAMAAGIPIPKGLLVMGVSGCGKSLAVKTVSAFWGVPLFRLDMNLVFSGTFGNPEAAFRGALKTVEAVAPAVLWIDEIENSLGMEENQLTIASHIFSAFLTWMQEKPPLVFVAATANKISALPAEILRKGRFDQVFFVDLPTEPERREILSIHLGHNDADMAEFDLKMLGIMTEGWNGAEIEQAVAAARIEAYYHGRQFNMADMSDSIATMIPLSQTMEEQIKFIRSWAFTRATPASKYGRSTRRVS